MKNLAFALLLGLNFTPLAHSAPTGGSALSPSPNTTGVPAPSVDLNSPSTAPNAAGTGTLAVPNNTSTNPSNINGNVNASPTTSSASDASHSAGASLSHQQIMDAQRALSTNGINVTQDGVAGPMTTNAVRQFQAKQGLPQTGELDSQTVNELNAATQSNPTPYQAPREKATDTPSGL